MARKKHHKKSTKSARRHSGAKHNSYGKMNRRHARRGRKHNGYFSRGRKRNDAGSGSMGMVILKAFGVVALSAAAVVGASLLLSSTSLSSMAQDGVLVLGGLVFGGIAFAAKKTGLGIGLASAMFGVAALRTSLSIGITSRMSSLVTQVQQLAGSSTLPAPTAQTAAAPAATAPSGWVVATPPWGGQLGMGGQSAQLGSIANMTTPMVGAYLG